MLKIGLTGGIGSGKTTVAGIFEVLGIPVYYADDAARRLMNENATLKDEIIRHFGEAAYQGGRLNREYLAAQVFQNKEKLAILNSLTHPLTLKDADQWMKSQSGPYVIKEAALIFESGSNKNLDAVIGVDAPEELRISRTMARDGISRDKVLARMQNQIPAAEKMALCRFVIVNDDRQALIPQVLEIHKSLLALSAAPLK